MGVSCYLPHSTAADARPTQTAIIPHTPRRTLCSSTQTAYYNNVYKRVQHTADHASPAGSAPTVCRSLASAAPGVPAEGSAPPPVQGQPGGLRSGTGSACRPPPGRAVQQQERGGRRGTIGGYRRSSFRAFARSLIEVSNSRSVPAGIVAAASEIVVANSRSFSNKIVVK